MNTLYNISQRYYKLSKMSERNRVGCKEKSNFLEIEKATYLRQE